MAIAEEFVLAAARRPAGGPAAGDPGTAARDLVQLDRRAPAGRRLLLPGAIPGHHRRVGSPLRRVPGLRHPAAIPHPHGAAHPARQRLRPGLCSAVAARPSGAEGGPRPERRPGRTGPPCSRAIGGLAASRQSARANSGGAQARWGIPMPREMALAPARTAGPTRLASMSPAGNHHRDGGDHLVPLAPDRGGHRDERLRHVAVHDHQPVPADVGEPFAAAPSRSTGTCSGSCTSGRARTCPPGTPGRRGRAAPVRRRWNAAATGHPRGTARSSPIVPESRSTRTASVSSRTASRTCCRVATDRSPITGIAASRSPWLRGARAAISHSRRPIT